MLFSIWSKNTVYDRVFNYVYGDINDVESAEIIDLDEKTQQAGETSAGGHSRSAEGHSQDAAEIDEVDAHQVYQQIIDRAYEVKVEIDGSVDVSDGR